MNPGVYGIHVWEVVVDMNEYHIYYIHHALR